MDYAHKGDEKYLQRAYWSAHTAVSQKVCMWCKAEQSGELIYSAYGDRALHRETLLSSEDFTSQVAGVQTFTALPGWHLSCIMPDWLHIVDLTIIPECAASALVELCGTDCWAGENFEDRLHRAYVSFVAQCRRYKVRSLSLLFGELCF